ncbi:MAG TPA: SDR family oxidoreductase [Steroidobacteraceae bacterium]|nr:SDR family oxidoreductase [Steroidobacteraceae bacterium]
MTTIAVTGATGKLGRATLQHLTARGLAPESIRPIVRDLAKAHDLVDRRFDVAYGNYTDAALLEAAFSGVEKLLFISTSALGEERMLHHRNVVSAARGAGVKHIIYTSVVKPLAVACFAASPGHFHTEALIRESGIPYTFFRNNLYLDIVPFVFGGALATGTLSHSGGNGRIGFVAREDIAEGLARVLTSDGHLNREYPITVNRECYGLPEIAAELGRASGRIIQYKPLTTDEFRLFLQQAGLPPPVVEMSVAMGDAVRAGEFDLSSPVFEQLLGRAPVDLRTFLGKTLAAAH